MIYFGFARLNQALEYQRMKEKVRQKQRRKKAKGEISRERKARAGE